MKGASNDGVLRRAEINLRDHRPDQRFAGCPPRTLALTRSNDSCSVRRFNAIPISRARSARLDLDAKTPEIFQFPRTENRERLRLRRAGLVSSSISRPLIRDLLSILVDRGNERIAQLSRARIHFGDQRAADGETEATFSGWTGPSRSFVGHHAGSRPS